jgi:myo-inositol-1(or 4)-monophosphatase
MYNGLSDIIYKLKYMIYKSMNSPSDLSDVAVRAANEAGKVIREKFGHVKNVRIKHGNWRDLVTDVDLKANRIILDILKGEFPDHGIMSEESKPDEKGSDYVWHVDPLDGTTNYTMAFPFAGTCIGLTFKDKPILGIVYNPMINEMFVGEDGKGATLNGEMIKVSKNSELKKTFVTYCYNNTIPESIKTVGSMFLEFKTKARDYRKLGAGNLEICYVACGRNDVYFRPDTILHDVIPGYMVAKEAGARITDWEGRQWNLGSKSLLVTNDTELHGEVMKIIKNNK